MKQSLRFILCIWIATFLPTACAIQISQSSSPTQIPTQLVDESTNIPVTWGNLNLTGRLLYVVADFVGGSSKGGLRVALRSLDLVTGNVTTIFETEVGRWISSFAVAPDLQSMIISYASPSASSIGPREGLYVLPLDGSKPLQLLFTPPTEQDQYTQPEWSPDGKYLYFVRFSSQSAADYEIMRMEYPNGKAESLVKQAYWPTISADGARLAYVSVFSANGPNGLFLANADGADTQPVPLLGSGWTDIFVDAPLFLPDKQSILFSAPLPAQSSTPGWVERLFGITVANAHGYIPSEWWSVPRSGGEPRRLTHLYSPGLFASLSPDSQFIASYSASGIFVMDPAGGHLTKIVNYTGGITGEVRWIP